MITNNNTVNVSELFKLMKERNVKQVDFAKVRGISRAAANAKLNGKSAISLEDANDLSILCKMSNKEIVDIFFKKYVDVHST